MLFNCDFIHVFFDIDFLRTSSMFSQHLFLGFSEHQERLRKKLALEEGRIFAANEQVS